MFTKRLFNLIVAAVVVVIVSLAVQQAFATKAIAPETDDVYFESKEEALREYQLGERYGALPDQIAELILEQKIRREYILGARYGVMPQQDARNESYRSLLDECSDVGLIYRAQCLSESQKSTP